MSSRTLSILLLGLLLVFMGLGFVTVLAPELGEEDTSTQNKQAN